MLTSGPFKEHWQYMQDEMENQVELVILTGKFSSCSHSGNT